MVPNSHMAKLVSGSASPGRNIGRKVLLPEQAIQGNCPYDRIVPSLICWELTFCKCRWWRWQRRSEAEIHQWDPREVQGRLPLSLLQRSAVAGLWWCESVYTIFLLYFQKCDNTNYVLYWKRYWFQSIMLVAITFWCYESYYNFIFPEKCVVNSGFNFSRWWQLVLLHVCQRLTYLVM